MAKMSEYDKGLQFGLQLGAEVAAKHAKAERQKEEGARHGGDARMESIYGNGASVAYTIAAEITGIALKKE